jgi:nicotinamide-nucleotide amidase
MSHELAQSAERLLKLAAARQMTIACAESCTAGLLSQVLCDAPGAASLVHGGFVTYTKAQKVRALGVPTELLRRKGAVCIEVACAMAAGALQHSPAHLSVAITGVAGPEPDEDGNPVGRVCIAIAARDEEAQGFACQYEDRGPQDIRQSAVADALTALMERLTRSPSGSATAQSGRS